MWLISLPVRQSALTAPHASSCLGQQCNSWLHVHQELLLENHTVHLTWCTPILKRQRLLLLVSFTRCHQLLIPFMRFCHAQLLLALGLYVVCRTDDKCICIDVCILMAVFVVSSSVQHPWNSFTAGSCQRKWSLPWIIRQLCHVDSMPCCICRERLFLYMVNCEWSFSSDG